MAIVGCQPIPTSEQPPQAELDGMTVFAWSATFEQYVIVPARIAALYPKNYTHWLPVSVLPTPDEAKK